MNEALQLIRELDAATPHVEGLSLRVTEFIRNNDLVEGVGSHEEGSIVYFDPSCKGECAIHAKVMASYGTHDGRVLYDLALSYTGGETFAETVPLRDVVPSMVRALGEANASGVVPKVLTLDVPESEIPNVVAAFSGSEFDIPAEQVQRTHGVMQTYLDSSLQSTELRKQ
jgi:hypothetical protein